MVKSSFWNRPFVKESTNFVLIPRFEIHRCQGWIEAHFYPALPASPSPATVIRQQLWFTKFRTIGRQIELETDAAADDFALGDFGIEEKVPGQPIGAVPPDLP